MFTDHRCHILHVTENDANSDLSFEIVKKNPSLSLERVRTTAEAIDVLKGRQIPARPNLLLIDWALADGLGGAELLTVLKSDRTLKSVPVLVLANALSRRELGHIYTLGASCVVIHGLSPDVFAGIVELICKFWGDIASLPYCGPAKPAIV